MRSIWKGLLWGLIGFILGVVFLGVIRALAGLSFLAAGPSITVGFLFWLVGWLLGVGLWEYWGREWFNLEPRSDLPEGWRAFFTFNTDHKVVGIQYLVAFMAMFFVAGLLAMLMRTELLAPGRDVFNSAVYNDIMSLHGTMMVFVGVAATVGAFGNYVVPLIIGAEDMAYPNLNALSFWFVPPVMFLLMAAPFAYGYDTGWTGYVPLATTTRIGELFYNLSFFTLGFSSILGALNIIATVITLRVKGMSWDRLPIFAWFVDDHPRPCGRVCVFQAGVRGRPAALPEYFLVLFPPRGLRDDPPRAGDCPGDHFPLFAETTLCL